MQYTYMQRVRITAPFYQGHYGQVVGYQYNVEDPTLTPTIEYQILIENGHSTDAMTFPPNEIEPA